MNRFYIFCAALYGELLKFYYQFMFNEHNLKFGLNNEEARREKIIVSLTSYGRRVNAVLPLTIISLLRQTYKPDVLLLWLDDEHWNDNNLPVRLKRLTKYGLTIRYCKDFKSYKKLVPALEIYPNDIIITVDDDVFYQKTLIGRLVNAYKENPTQIYSTRAHKIDFTTEGELRLYNDWLENVKDESSHLVFPTGVGGCLYKKSLLHRDVCKEELFMQLAPNADDVWFYFMERLQGTICTVLPGKRDVYVPLDAFYQHFHKGSSLKSTNCDESQNDVQIKAVMEYYGLTVNDLKKRQL